MTTKYEALVHKVQEIDDLNKAASVLAWDKEVNMPSAGLSERVMQMTTLSKLIHKMATSDEMGEMIEQAAAEVNDLATDSHEASLMRVLNRQYANARKLTPEHVARTSKVSGLAHHAWIKARAENDFAAFQPWLEQVIELSQEQAALYGYEDEAYDALLDKYETDMKTAEVRAIFQSVKDALVPLREAIDARGTAVNDALLHQSYPISKQKKFAHYIADAIGYDFSRGHLGTVVHPFAISFSRNDSRITTRWHDDFVSPALFGTLHESGHAMYEQGTHPDYSRTPLARGTSLGIHESQSRMMENLVGRNAGFWKIHFPKLQETFPGQLGNHTANEFYRAINKVQSSFIRVESDELTYNFHIILRFELEQAMLNGDLKAADLPTAWNDKMLASLGIVPPTDTQGCLQDVHWTRPMLGYFPTYALGNLYASQFYETAVSQHPNIIDELNQGKTETLVEWLRENIHQHGKKYTPQELVQRVTGKPLSQDAFIRYVTQKFGGIYQL